VKRAAADASKLNDLSRCTCGGECTPIIHLFSDEKDSPKTIKRVQFSAGGALARERARARRNWPPITAAPLFAGRQGKPHASYTTVSHPQKRKHATRLPLHFFLLEDPDIICMADRRDR